MAIYDEIGTTYAQTRRPDPRVAAQIHAALGGATSVINVGAGAGSYEPEQTVLAVEPSSVMIAQRPPGSAPVVQARAEALPVASRAADAAMALLTMHHWTDLRAGIAELRRVARRRIVVFTWDQEVTRKFWLLREYLPEASAFDDRRAIPIPRLAAMLGGARVETVPVPRDCADGFGTAFWRRPEAYLDSRNQAGMSILAQLDEQDRAPGLRRLAADLDSGAWHRRHAGLFDQDEFDGGYRLLIAGS
jgi:SAM-dependent methyltransferase